MKNSFAFVLLIPLFAPGFSLAGKSTSTNTSPAMTQNPIYAQDPGVYQSELDYYYNLMVTRHCSSEKDASGNVTINKDKKITLSNIPVNPQTGQRREPPKTCGELMAVASRGMGDEDSCSLAKTEYNKRKAEGIALCKEFKAQTNDHAPCNLSEDLKAYEKSCDEEFAKVYEEEGDELKSKAKETIRKCPYLAARASDQKDIRSRLRDLRKDLNDEKKSCTNDGADIQKEIREKQAELQKVQNSIPNIIKNSQTKAAAELLKMTQELTQLQNQIKTLSTTEALKVRNAYQGTEADAESECQSQLIKAARDTYEKAKHKARSMTSRSVKQIAIADARAQYKICVANAKNKVLQAYRNANVIIQDINNKLTLANDAQKQLQSQISLVQKSQNDQLQADLQAARENQQALYADWKAAVQKSQSQQALCNERIRVLTAEIGEVAGQSDHEEEEMSGLLEQAAGQPKSLLVFADVTESQAKKAEEERDERNKAVKEIESAAAAAYGACCSQSQSNSVCDAFKGDFMRDPILHKYGTGTR